MTELPPAAQPTAERHWLLKTIGLAIGLAVLLVAVVLGGILVLESPASRRAAAVQAAPAATAAPDAASSAAAPEPTATEASTVEPTQTPTEVVPTATPLPTRTPQPTATAAAIATATRTTVQTSSVTRASAATRPAAKSASVKPGATSTPVLPLELFFYVKAYCHKKGTSTQVVDLFLTGHGGVPPYDYYNDTTFIGQSTGMVRFTVKAASGNPVPYKVIVLDSSGQRYVKEFFYKTGLHCK